MLSPMAEGGQWLRAPHDAPPVYLAPKQREAHLKRLVGDGWMPCDDPRQDQPQAVVEPVIGPEVALQARIDQLEAQLQQVLAMFAVKNGQDDATQINDVSTHSEDSHDDQRPKRNKAIRRSDDTGST
jgi:hypothetical protein